MTEVFLAYQFSNGRLVGNILAALEFAFMSGAKHSLRSIKVVRKTDLQRARKIAATALLSKAVQKTNVPQVSHPANWYVIVDMYTAPQDIHSRLKALRVQEARHALRCQDQAAEHLNCDCQKRQRAVR